MRKVAEKLARTGDSGLSIKATNQSMEVILKDPDRELFAKLMPLLRPFLTTSNFISYESVWFSMRNDFPDKLTAEAVEDIDSHIRKVNSSYFNLNGESISLKRAYELIGEAEHFDPSEKNVRDLHNLVGDQTALLLLRSGFQAYHREGYHIVTKLYTLLKQIETNTAPSRASKRKNKCIYCLSTEGKFNSREHIISESIGNTELILDEGDVCDNCNNTTLSNLDQALANFPPIAYQRVQLGIKTKKRKTATAKFQNVSMEQVSPTEIKFRMKADEEPIEETAESLQFLLRNEFDYLLVARAIYKIALGAFALLHGRDAACDPKFDRARTFICEGFPFANNMMLYLGGKDANELGIRHEGNLEGTLFSINLYGSYFIVSLEEQPLLELTKEMKQLGYVLFPLNISGQKNSTTGVRASMVTFEGKITLTNEPPGGEDT